MAYMEVLGYTDIGTGTVHDATSWQFAKDKEFTKIIDESLNDKVNIKKWVSMLPMLKEDLPPGVTEAYYKDLDQVYGRFKVHAGEYVSDWFEVEPQSQNYQEVIVTEEGQDDIITDSTTIDMQ